MSSNSILPLSLGLILFSFFITSSLVEPFIDLLYKLKITRRKEGGVKGAEAESLFDKLHDKKAGTPIGGGILIIFVVSVLFAIIIPLASYLGVDVRSSFNLESERFILFFTFISFGLIGLLDDVVKIFGKPKPGKLGSVFGLTKKQKFALQWSVAFIIGYYLYQYLGIRIIHIPLVDVVFHINIFYIPLAAFVIVFFANAFNFTDGLDGLATGLLMIYLFAYIIIAAGNLDSALFIFTSIWLGALMAFLYFNVPPARVFLGDAGALSFGATIAVIGLITGNISTLFVIGGIFVVEAASSLIQIFGWKVFKRRIFPIAPIHHTFLAIGWQEPKIVMRAWLVGIMLAIFGLWLALI